MYYWDQVSNNIAIPPRDGAGCCVHDGKMRLIGGYLPGPITYNNVFNGNGINWAESAAPRSFIRCHSMPVISHQDRILRIGNDFITGAYDPTVHSWDGLETSAWQQEVLTPALNRVGHWGLSFAGYAMFGGGQTVTPLTPTPSKFYSDVWRSVTGLGDTWEQVELKSAMGARGYFCGSPAILGDEAYFIGGGFYETSDFPRGYRSDIYAMDTNFKVRLVNARALPYGLIYHSIASFDNNLWILAGRPENNPSVDTNDWYRSANCGQTWVKMPTPPWVARHAAVAQEFEGSLHFLAGSNYQRDHWKLNKSIPGTIHYNSNADSSTSWGNNFTIVDRTIQIPNGITVASIGALFNNSHSDVYVKIFKENSANNFDIMYSSSINFHSGGMNYEDYPVNFIIPNSGIYRIGLSATINSETFCSIGSRSLKVGNIIGNNQTLSPYNDGTIPLRWTEG